MRGLRERSWPMVGIAIVLLVGLAIVVFGSMAGDPPSAPPSAPGARAPAPRPDVPPDAATAARVAPPSRPDGMAAGDEGEGVTATASLRVLVRYDDGAPAADRGVLVVAERPGRFRRARRATTDAEGVAELGELPAVRHRVQVGRAPSQEVDLAAQRQAELTFELRRGVDICGRVVDAFGAPVARAVIWGTRDYDLDHDAVTPVGISQHDGTFRIEGYALPLYAWIAARRPGLGASPWRLVLARSEEEAAVSLRGVELRLGSGRATLLGVCLDADGEPCAGVGVHVAPIGVATEHVDGVRYRPGHEYHATTGEDGRFRFDDLGAHTWTVAAFADGLWFEPREIVLRHDTDAASVELTAVAAATIAGVVTDEQERPVAKAHVQAHGLPHDPVVAGDDGSFALHDLPPRKVELLAMADGFEPLTTGRDLHSGPNEVRLVMTPKPCFVGVVRDRRGQPLAGWRIGAIPEGAKGGVMPTPVAADGRFELPVKAREPHVFTITAPDCPFRVALDALGSFMPGPDPIELVVPDSALPSAAIVGSLPPIPDKARYLVGIRNQERQSLARFGESTLDHETGAFRMAPLPAGTWWLLVQVRQQVPGSWHGAVGECQLGPFALAAGQTLDVGLLQLPAPGTLEYAFVVPQGCEPKDVKLELRSAASRSWGLVHVDPQQPGAFAIFPGDYGLTIWGEGFLEVERRVTVLPPPATATRVEVTLEPGQRRRLELALPAGEVRASFVVRDAVGRVTFEDEFGTDEAATVQRYPILGLGRHTLEVEGAGGRRYAGEFTVESLTPTRKVLKAPLREVR